MQVWKRRVAFVLAVGTGALGLTLSSAGAQTPPDFPTFPTFPTFPEFPTIPSTSPPPTMPPPTSPPSTSPPPTMPPPSFTIPTITTPPPTMPPNTSPPSTTPPGDVIDEFFDSLEGLLEEGADDFEEFSDAVNELIAELFG